jgi:hypothetical protein
VSTARRCARRFLACFVAVFLLGLGWPGWTLAADSLRVLFIGNSHTYVNDLPGLFAGLAQSGGRTAITDMSAPGGYSLMEHCADSTTLAKIAQGGWSFVALQEQSQIPTIEYWRDNGMYPSARRLDSLIRAQGCSTTFYMTWGWKNGGIMTWRGYSSPDFRDYFHMQDSVTAAYLMIAGELAARMSPVGMAWARAKRRDSLVDLWQSDECHATLEGTYLAACVFYAALFRANPVGLEFTGGLSMEDARFCQEVAWETVSGPDERPVSEPAPVVSLTVAPNPATNATTVSYTLLKAGTASLKFYDVTGQLVQVLTDGYHNAGTSSFILHPSSLSSGIYLLELETGNTTTTKKLIIE